MSEDAFFVLGSCSANEGRVENESVFWGVSPCLQGSGNLVPLLGPGDHSDTRTVKTQLKKKTISHIIHDNEMLKIFSLKFGTRYER